MKITAEELRKKITDARALLKEVQIDYEYPLD